MGTWFVVNVADTGRPLLPRPAGRRDRRVLNADWSPGMRCEFATDDTDIKLW